MSIRALIVDDEPLARERLHELLGCGKPKHPLITVLDPQQLQVTTDMRNVRVVSNFYAVWLKTTDCGIEYGRNHYDFEEGALVFTGPQQVVSVSGEVAEDAGLLPGGAERHPARPARHADHGRAGRPRRLRNP